MDINTEQYKAAITLSNLTMYDLTPLVWHVGRSNHIEGQITPDTENVRGVIFEWANAIDGEISETEHEHGEYTTVKMETNYGDFATFIKIWGHADRA